TGCGGLQAQLMIEPARDGHLAVGAESNDSQLTRMSHQWPAARTAGPEAPQTQGAFISAGNKSGAVWAECDGEYRVGMSLERCAMWLARRGGPQTYCLIAAA